MLIIVHGTSTFSFSFSFLFYDYKEVEDTLRGGSLLFLINVDCQKLDKSVVKDNNLDARCVVQLLLGSDRHFGYKVFAWQ